MPKWRGTRKQSLAQDIQSFVHVHVRGRQHFQKDTQTLKVLLAALETKCSRLMESNAPSKPKSTLDLNTVYNFSSQTQISSP